MAGWLSTDTLADPEAFATVGLLAIADPPAEEEPMEEPAAEEEPMDDTGEDESMDDTGEEEPMDDPGEEELPVTGSDSGLLAIVGAGILAAGLLVLGAGRRVRTATR